MKKIISAVLVILLISLVGCSASSEETKYKQMKILEGSVLETTAYIYNDEGTGKRFGIIGGIHGDETAGFTAAKEMMDEISSDYKNAKILFIPRANELAILQDKRYAEGHFDLNRCFLVKSPQNETEKLAKAIKDIVTEFSPEFIIDHHESKNNYLNTDGKFKLGNTVIVTDTSDNVIDNLFIIDNINEKIVDDILFKLETNPPSGSFNDTLSNELGIFVATIETNRKLELDKRVEEQRIITREIIKYFFEDGN